MDKKLRRIVAIFASGCLMAMGAAADSVSEKAKKLTHSAIVVDTHDDTTQRLLDPKFDLGVRHSDGSIDIPRMKEGGLDGIFFSIWMSGKVTGPEAVKRATAQIDAVREQVRKHPNEMVLATTAAEVRAAKKQGKIAALMGVEGGHMINSDLGVLRTYASLGVRYMTLTHSIDVEWADSSTGKAAHNGLTDFGKDVVREMNRLGMIVDISHVSEDRKSTRLNSSHGYNSYAGFCLKQKTCGQGARIRGGSRCRFPGVGAARALGLRGRHGRRRSRAAGGGDYAAGARVPARPARLVC